MVRRQTRMTSALAIGRKRGAGEIIMNGAVAHLGKQGDLLTIMNFCSANQKKARKWKPQVIVLGKGNKIVTTRGI